MREDLVENAVTFLKDPQVGSASAEKKVEFLESKGLTKEEISEAIRRAQDPAHQTPAAAGTTTESPSGAVSHAVAAPQGYQQQYYAPAPPPVPEKDWKDYFIMATATVGVGYALYEITRRYLIPNILPDSKTKLDKDKEAIEEEFLRVEAILNEISESQKHLKDNEEEKTRMIEETIESVQDLINDSKEKNSKIEDDVKYLKADVQNLKSSFDRSLEKQQQAISLEVASIQHELNSLQHLIKAKDSLANEFKNNGTGNTKSSPIPSVSSIPSASEILKRANLSTTQNLQQSTQPSQSPVPTPAQESSFTPPKAADIPPWQRTVSMETSESITSQRPDYNPLNHYSYTRPELPPQTSIPAWQQASQEESIIDDLAEDANEASQSSGSYSPREHVEIPDEGKLNPVGQ